MIARVRLYILFGIREVDVVETPLTSGIFHHWMTFHDKGLQFTENSEIKVCFTANVH